jgi:hypothetical protein
MTPFLVFAVKNALFLSFLMSMFFAGAAWAATRVWSAAAKSGD